MTKMEVQLIAPSVTSVSIAEAKSKLAALARRAELGETIIITRHGRNVAALGPAEPAGRPRSSILGVWRDEKVRIAEDFDETGPEWDEYRRG